MPKAAIADSTEIAYKVIAAQLAYTPGKYPKEYPHGHLTHVCPANRYLFGQPDAFPDIQFRIERVGGGAAAEGYAAIAFPGTTVEQPLLDALGNTVEDWTEEACFSWAYDALLGREIPKWDWDTANFPISSHVMLNGVQKMDAMSDCYQAAEIVDWALIP